MVVDKDSEEQVVITGSQDLVEQAARYYKDNASDWVEALEDLNKKEIMRLLKVMILYPLELDKVQFTSPKEPAMLEYTMKMLDAKMHVMAYSIERQKEKEKLSEEI